MYKVNIEDTIINYSINKKSNLKNITIKVKYPDIVTVYSIGDFSKELCGGPHVKHTGELGHFVIKKEQSNGSGVRRIKAILKD